MFQLSDYSINESSKSITAVFSLDVYLKTMKASEQCRVLPPWCLSCRSDPEHAAQPVSAVRQQLCRVSGVSGRQSHGHDQSAVLPRPPHPAEALPALWR